jgi:glutamine synthetase
VSPGEPISGNSYSSDGRRLPVAMHEALELFRESSFVSEAIGMEMQRSFTLTKEQELTEFSRHVTSLEYQAYIERL